MKNVVLSLFFVLFTYRSILAGWIVETPHFDLLSEQATPKTLVILDIDDTLLIPAQTLGTDVWFQYRWDSYRAAHSSGRDALEKALADWEGVRHLTKIKIVEEGSDQVVRDIQNKNITVMGLTTQGIALTTRTIQQLASLNIDLSRTAPSAEDYYFMNGQGVLYRQGILFTAGTVKGTALMHFLDHIGSIPERIVFINDKASHLKDVEAAVTARDIEFVGLRYSYSDARVNTFQPEIADIQWKYSSFDHILSDTEALELLNTRSP